MADKTLRTRIALLYKTYAEWQEQKTSVLLKGEIGICEVPGSTGAVADEPCILFKVGDGTKTFEQLPWSSALAADVYAWAKKENLDFTDLSEEFLTALSEFITSEVPTTDTQYQLVSDGDYKWKLQKSTDGETWEDATGSIDVSGLNTRIATLETAIETKQDVIDADNKLAADVVSFDPTGTSGSETPMTSTDVQAAIAEAWAAIGSGGTSAVVNVVKKETAETGYAATYYVTQGGTQVGASINIPKDYLVKSAEIKVVTKDDDPYTGAKVGDKYIDFVINVKEGTGNEDHIYLPVKDLVDVYKADENTLTLSDDNTFSVKAIAIDKVTDLQSALDLKATVDDLTAEVARATAAEATKVDKVINGTNGKAEIFNEADGGGAKFTHTDGTESFVGVNDGGEDGLAAQIYADKLVEGKWSGAKLDVTNGGMYYTVGDKSRAERDVPENELAVKGDIATAIEEAKKDLADIAFTGNVNDLVQDDDDVLILQCNF